MNIIIKTCLVLFTISQVAMAGRMYDPEIGRFISRDKLGYVDGMSLYNAYFAERFAVDPSGTKIKEPKSTPPEEWKPFDRSAFNDNSYAWFKANWEFDVVDYVTEGCCFIEINLAMDNPEIWYDSSRDDISGPEHIFTTRNGKKKTVREHEEGHFYIALKHYRALADELKSYEFFEVPCDEITIWKNLIKSIYNVHVTSMNFDQRFLDFVDYGKDGLEGKGNEVDKAIKAAKKASAATGR